MHNIELTFDLNTYLFKVMKNDLKQWRNESTYFDNRVFYT